MKCFPVFQVCPKNIADRVNLGLIPTSSLSWATACHALNQNKGGWLHIHENVDSGTNALDSGAKSLDGGVVNAFSRDPVKKTGGLEISQDTVETKFVLPEDRIDVTKSERFEDLNLVPRTFCGETERAALDTRRIVNKETDLSTIHEKSTSLIAKTDNDQPPECDVLKNRNLVRNCYKGNLSENKRAVLQVFTDDMLLKLKSYLPPSWNATLHHIEYVKSYAPHVDHFVFDVECRPMFAQHSSPF